MASLDIKAALNPANMTQREKIMSVGFLLVLLIYGFWSLYWKPQMNQLKSLEQVKAARQNEYNEYLAKGYNNSKEIKRQIAQIQSNISSLWTKVPPNKDTPGIIVNLYDLATKDNIDLNSDSGLISIGALETANDYSSYIINMNIKGSHESVYTFIYDVENLNRLVWLENADISVLNAGQLACNMTLRIFVLGQVKPDPQDYPFMFYERPGDPPYQMFHMAPGAQPATPSGNDFIPEPSYTEPDYSTDQEYTNPLLPQPGDPPATSSKADIPTIPSTNPTTSINPSRK
ncbi:MAG: type 4a pilus biogenesis protein PilO [Acidobacteriota bacterium]